jgi:hypothetical protein
LNEFIAENPPNLGKEMDIQLCDTFRTPNRHDQKKTAYVTLWLKTPRLHTKNIESSKRESPRITGIMKQIY